MYVYMYEQQIEIGNLLYMAKNGAVRKGLRGYTSNEAIVESILYMHSIYLLRRIRLINF